MSKNIREEHQENSGEKLRKKDFGMIKINQEQKSNVSISFAGEGYAARIQNKVSRIRENFSIGKSINKIKKSP